MKNGLDKIANMIVDYFSKERGVHLSVEEMKSRSQETQLVYARHIFMYLCDRHKIATQKNIAIYLKYKKHDPVLYAIRKINEEKGGNDSKSQMIRQDMKILEDKAFEVLGLIPGIQ